MDDSFVDKLPLDKEYWPRQKNCGCFIATIYWKDNKLDEPDALLKAKLPLQKRIRGAAWQQEVGSEKEHPHIQLYGFPKSARSELYRILGQSFGKSEGCHGTSTETIRYCLKPGGTSPSLYPIIESGGYKWWAVMYAGCYWRADAAIIEKLRYDYEQSQRWKRIKREAITIDMNKS